MKSSWYMTTLSISLCSALVACSSSPLILKGRVTDQAGTAIKGASVRTEPYTDNVSTNQSGYFFINRHLVNQGQQIKPLEAGQYKLIIESTGYETVTLPITLNEKHTQTQKHVYRLRQDLGDFKKQEPIKQDTKDEQVHHGTDSPKSGPP